MIKLKDGRYNYKSINYSLLKLDKINLNNTIIVMSRLRKWFQKLQF